METAVKTALRKDAVGVQSILAMDISFLTESDEKVQPENGETVPVTLSVLDNYAEYVKDAAFLVVYHMAEQADGSLVAEPVQCVQYTDAQQKISFGATGFSIYAVAAVGKKDGTFVTDKNAGGNVFYEMEEESSRVFFFQDSHSANYRYHRYTWTVENNNDTVQKSIHFCLQNKSACTPVQAARVQASKGSISNEEKKSEPIPHREKVRIFHVWWTIQDSIADFAPWGKIIWMPPVFELAAARRHRHLAFRWVQFLHRPLKRGNTT